jgi:hypothetical protein
MIEEFIFANQCSHGRNLKWRNARIDRVKGDKLVGNYYVAFESNVINRQLSCHEVQ